MTDHEIRRQNIILANENIDSSPSAQEKRRKMYMQEMKDKKISSKIIDLKVSNGSPETTKSKNTRKYSTDSIPGIEKETKVKEVVPTE